MSGKNLGAPLGPNLNAPAGGQAAERFQNAVSTLGSSPPLLTTCAPLSPGFPAHAGLGIHVLRSFTHGGDWILQPALSNAPDLARLLPPGAPLSTLRVITASRHWLAHQPDLTADGVSTAPVQQLDQSGRVGGGLNGLAPTARDAAFSVMTVVLRAGRAGALTDHNCLCFPIDVSTGRLLPGRSNQVCQAAPLLPLLHTPATQLSRLTLVSLCAISVRWCLLVPVLGHAALVQALVLHWHRPALPWCKLAGH